MGFLLWGLKKFGVKIMTGFYKDQRGFTLIEVLISIAILMIVGAFLFDSLFFTLYTNAASKNMTIATDLAHEEMERIKALTDWDQIVDSARASILDYPNYERKVEVVNQSVSPPLKKVTVTVYWQNKDIQITTLLSQHGRPLE